MQKRLIVLAAATVLTIVAAVVLDRGTSDSTTAVAAGPDSTTPSTIAGDAPPTTVAPTTVTTRPAGPTPAPDGKALLLVSNNGVVMPVVGRSGEAYQLRTPCGGEVQWKTGGRLVGEVQVMLDPGHGGLDQGASTASGLTEAVLNLDIALRTRAALQAMGIRAALTRESDYFLPIDRSVEIAAQTKPKVFVSIHHNSGNAAIHASGPGMEIYHQLASPEARRLGGLVWEEMFTSFANKFPIAWWGASDAGVIYRPGSDGKSDYFGVLRKTAGVIPAILIEAGYMSNPAEAALMVGDEYRQTEAQAIANGVRRFLTTTDLGSGFQTPNDRSSTINSGGTTSQCKEPKIV